MRHPPFLIKMRIKFNQYSIPFVLFIICVISYGLLVQTLGFYSFDWQALLLTRLKSLSLLLPDAKVQFASVWFYQGLSGILDTDPLRWQLFSIFTRFVSLVALWWSLLKVWPYKPREVSWAAILFAIYPSFGLQGYSVTFSPYWCALGFFFLSIGSMALAGNKSGRKKYWLFTSMVFTAIYISIAPQLILLELVRFPIIYIIMHENGERPRWTAIFRFGWIYIATAFVCYILVWQIQGGKLFLPSIAITALDAFQKGLQDLIYIAIYAWASAIDPNVFDLGSRITLLTVFASGVTGLLIGFYLNHIEFKSDLKQNAENKKIWITQAVGLGGLFILIAMLLTAFMSIEIIGEPLNGVPGLVGSIGMSLVIVAILESWIPGKTQKIIVLSVLVGLVIGFNLRTANDLRWNWVAQQGLYRQLFWRAPKIQSGSVIYKEGPLLDLPDASATAVLNWLYNFENLDQQGKPLIFHDLNLMSNNGQTNSVEPGIIISYNPEKGQCLWILSPEDFERPEVPKLTRNFVQISELDKIILPDDSPGAPPVAIFGVGGEKSWCYYFQKAELARQAGNWAEVAQHGDQAIANGQKPDSRQEWVPFIEAYANVGRWEEATELSERIFKEQESLSEWLCSTWERVLNDASPPASSQVAIENMLNQHCIVAVDQLKSP